MAWITIKGEGVRNLDPFQIDPAEKLTFIWGDNGAGKTSILEAVCFLSTGRSFRGHKKDAFIATNKQKTTLFGEWQKGNIKYKIGLQRDRNNLLINHINSEKQTTLKNNNELLAVKVITPDIFSSVIGRADQRRELLDWPLFHVEQSFRNTKTKLKKIIKQRNAALRAKKNNINTNINEIKIWDESLVQLAQQLNKHRELCANKLQATLVSLEGAPGKWLKHQQINVKYQQGWPKGKDLQQMLNQSIEKDISKGFTQYGPHRFDFTLLTNKDPVAEVFSRGELKTLAVASQICQIQRLIEKQQSVVVLVDDLFAELDTEHSTWCLNELYQANKLQAFITGINIPKAVKQRYSGKGIGWFHVEHGRINEVKTPPNKQEI